MKIFTRFKRLVLSLIAIWGGLGILLVSFFRTAEIVATSQPNLETSNRRIYFGEVKPDHVLYPLVAFKEQASLNFLSSENKIRGELRLADIRLQFAQEFFNDDENDLALDTLIKAEQLLFMAAQDFSELNQSNHELRQVILLTLYRHQAALNQILTASPTHQDTKINELIEQQKGVVQSLAQ